MSQTIQQIPMMTEVIRVALINGLYHEALKHVAKHEKLIFQTIEKHQGEKWIRKWLVRKIIQDQKITPKYEVLINDILEVKYEVF